MTKDDNKMLKNNKKTILNNNKKNLRLEESFKIVLSNLTQVTIIFIVIGFINIWFYLYRIEQLNLLTVVISTPSTLLAIFASMSLIILLWVFLYITPTMIFLWLSTIYKKNTNEIIFHTFLISLFLAIFGAYPANVVIAIFIYIAMFYVCYLLYHFNTNIEFKNKKPITNLLLAIFINLPLIIVLAIIYNKASLYNIDRSSRVFVLILNLAPIYAPLLYADYVIKKRKNISIREILISSVLTTATIGYIFMMSTSGMFLKLNDTTMSFSGLRSNELYWVKVNKKKFPKGWLEENWDIKENLHSEIWLQGFPLFYNNNTALICPQSTMDAMMLYSNSRLTAFSNSPKGSMNSSKCILIENPTTKLIKKENKKTYTSDIEPAVLI